MQSTPNKPEYTADGKLLPEGKMSSARVNAPIYKSHAQSPTQVMNEQRSYRDLSQQSSVTNLKKPNKYGANMALINTNQDG